MGVKKDEGIDLVISFDTTGSMYPCLTQLRRKVEACIKKLFTEVPQLRVGVIAHGDYCDAGVTYVTKTLDLTTDKDKICNFVRTVGQTYGGDAPECYELVLHEARSLSWTARKAKAFVLIGDDVPHGPSYRLNTKNLDWRNEIDCLQEMGVSVYGCHALANYRTHAASFYKEIAKKTGGFYLTLDQFSHVAELLTAIAFKQEGDEQLKNFEQELVKSRSMTRSLESAVNTMLGRKTKTTKSRYKTTDLESVPSGRFQVMSVDEDAPIRDFVNDNGVEFKKGRGFYEFTKRVIVQPYKEVVLINDDSGDMFSGDKARKMLGLPETGVGENEKISPSSLSGYTAFIQSTSVNRKLLAGTKFLYEVSDYDK